MYPDSPHMAEAWLRSRVNSMEGTRARSRGPRWNEEDVRAVKLLLEQARKNREDDK